MDIELNQALEQVSGPRGTEKPLAVYPVAAFEKRYIDHLARDLEGGINLAKWVPSLGKHLRPLMPGEMVAIMGDTGVGKTAVAQSISLSVSPRPVLFFEMEVAEEIMFERTVQIACGIAGDAVERLYREDEKPDWKKKPIDHIYICPLPRMSGDEMEETIRRSAQVIGEPPHMVVVDYLGLMRGFGKTQHEKVSGLAEQLKVIARSTGVVMIVLTQVARPEGSDNAYVPSLHDAKYSGSIECSSGVVIGIWRTDRQTLMLKVLKSTRSGSGDAIACNFDGATLRITERINV